MSTSDEWGTALFNPTIDGSRNGYHSWVLPKLIQARFLFDRNKRIKQCSRGAHWVPIFSADAPHGCLTERRERFPIELSFCRIWKQELILNRFPLPPWFTGRVGNVEKALRIPCAQIVTFELKNNAWECRLQQWTIFNKVEVVQLTIDMEWM